MTDYAVDTFYTKVTIVTGVNDVFQITESTPTVVTVTLDAGDYWLHVDSSYNSTMSGLFWAIQKVLNDGTTAGLGARSGTPTNTDYDFAVVDPSSSTGLANNGLELRATGGTLQFDIDWDDAAFTMDARWFGAATNTQGAALSSATDGSDKVTTSPCATKHRMVTRTWLDGVATTKVREPYIDAEFSSGRPSDSVSMVWDSGFIRMFQYDRVPGVEVHSDRAGESAWSATMTRLQGDKNAVWFDVWAALARGEQVLVVHNSSGDLQVDTHSYEVLKMRATIGWKDMFDETSRGGNYYTVSFAAWVDETKSSYDH